MRNIGTVGVSHSHHKHAETILFVGLCTKALQQEVWQCTPKHIPMCCMERTLSENSALWASGSSSPTLRPRIRSRSVYVLSTTSMKTSISLLTGWTLASGPAEVWLLYCLQDSRSSLGNSAFECNESSMLSFDALRFFASSLVLSGEAVPATLLLDLFTFSPL